jgi:phosphatidylglycerol:prolipoprotein diacylglycerol transferase
MSDYTRVYFEGLGIDFDVPSVAFTIGSYSIHWYGIIIAFGFALAVLYGGRMAYKWKMSLDGMTDVLMWGTILGIVFARAYYVIFEWSYYKEHLSEIPQIWNGGIAIYGGIIGAFIGAIIGCKIGKIDFRNLLDLGGLGLLIGQGIGRWGNFFNQEAFGTLTPTSITVVETNMSTLPCLNSCMIASFSSFFIFPCNNSIDAFEPKWCSNSTFRSMAFFKSSISDSSIKGEIK